MVFNRNYITTPYPVPQAPDVQGQPHWLPHPATSPASYFANGTRYIQTQINQQQGVWIPGQTSFSMRSDMSYPIASTHFGEVMRPQQPPVGPSSPTDPSMIQGLNPQMATRRTRPSAEDVQRAVAFVTAVKTEYAQSKFVEPSV